MGQKTDMWDPTGRGRRRDGGEWSPITQSVCRKSLPVFRSGAGGRRGSKCYSPALPVLLRHCHPVSTVPGEAGKALGEEGQQATESLNAALEGPGWVQSLKQGWGGRLWHRVSLAGLKASLISSLRARSWRKKVSRAAAGMGDTGTEGANTVMESISQVSDLGISPSSIPPVHLPLGGPLDCSAQRGPGCSHLPRPVPHLAHSTTAPPTSFRPSTDESPSLCPPFLLLWLKGCHVLFIFPPKNN